MTSDLLKEAQAKLSEFVEEEIVLGPHRGLDDRFAYYIFRLAQEIKDIRNGTPKISQVWPNGEITITLMRNDTQEVHIFGGPRKRHGMPIIFKTKDSNIKNPDEDGYTWFMERGVGLLQPRILIPLTPHEGPLIYKFIYETPL
jgi:hypothetical protein